MIDIKNRNALITGSTRGVGRQIALGLAELGCNIIVHGRQKENCEKILEDLEKYNIRTYCVYGDLSEEAAVKDIIRQIRKLDINVDVLYNNAGIQTAYRGNIWEHTREDWLKSYKINVIAMYDLCAAFIPDMLENGFGRIVNVTSRINELPELMPYGCSKWAVDKLTNEIAVKLKDTPLRINSLDPTWLRTDLGGEYAPNPVESVLPGALDPVLIDDDGPNGEIFSAIERTHKRITESF